MVATGDHDVSELVSEHAEHHKQAFQYQGHDKSESRGLGEHSRNSVISLRKVDVRGGARIGSLCRNQLRALTRWEKLFVSPLLIDAGFSSTDGAKIAANMNIG
jgi:hypothetical protein